MNPSQFAHLRYIAESDPGEYTETDRDAARAALAEIGRLMNVLAAAGGPPCDCQKVNRGGAIVGRVPDPYCRMHRDPSAL